MEEQKFVYFDQSQSEVVLYEFFEQGVKSLIWLSLWLFVQKALLLFQLELSIPESVCILFRFEIDQKLAFLVGYLCFTPLSNVWQRKLWRDSGLLSE